VQSFQDKMARVVNQYILEEGSSLNDSSDGLPLRRQLSARGTGTRARSRSYPFVRPLTRFPFCGAGVAALCPPEWKSLRHEVDGILFVENVFLVLYNQLRSFLKSAATDSATGGALSPRGSVNAAQLPIPIRLVRDAIEVCRYTPPPPCGVGFG
jgi:hypothetical protein